MSVLTGIKVLPTVGTSAAGNPTLNLEFVGLPATSVAKIAAVGQAIETAAAGKFSVSADMMLGITLATVFMGF